MENSLLNAGGNIDKSLIMPREIDVKEVSKNLKKYIKKNNESGYKLEKKIEGIVSKQTIYNILGRKKNKVNIETVWALENALNIRLFERYNTKFDYMKFREAVNHSSVFVNSEYESVEDLLVVEFNVNPTEFIVNNSLPPIDVQEQMSIFFDVKLNKLFSIDGEKDYTAEKLHRVHPKSQAPIDYDALLNGIKNLPQVYQNLIVNYAVDMQTLAEREVRKKKNKNEVLPSD